MHELMFQTGVKGMSERSELIPCNIYIYIYKWLLLVEISCLTCLLCGELPRLNLLNA